MSEFLAQHAANPGRAGHRMAVAAERMLEDTRLKLARMACPRIRKKSPISVKISSQSKFLPTLWL